MHDYLSKYTDQQLWDLMQKGNKNAFNVLYKRHVQALYNFGLRLTNNQALIKDSLQELFADFWIKRAKQSEVRHVRVYLIKAFRNKLLRKIQQSKKQRTYSFEELFQDFAEDAPDDQAAINRRKALKQQIRQLPERQQEVIHLRYFQNLKHEEIAEILNVNYQSVSNLLHRALNKLKANFES